MQERESGGAVRRMSSSGVQWVGRSSKDPLFWASDAPDCKKQVRQEVRSWLDTVLAKVEKVALIEQRRADRENEKRDAQRRRVQQKQERDIERDIVACVEKMIRKLEKEHAVDREEDGQPFVDSKPIKASRAPVFKVRGAPCVEFFECLLPGGGRNNEAEAAVRAARNEVRASKPPPPPPPPPLSWIDPSTLGKPWTILTLLRQQVRGGCDGVV